MRFEYKSGTKCEVQFTNLTEIKFDDGNNKMVKEAYSLISANEM